MFYVVEALLEMYTIIQALVLNVSNNTALNIRKLMCLEIPNSNNFIHHFYGLIGDKYSTLHFENYNY